MLTTLMLQKTEQYGTTPNAAKVSEDALQLLRVSQGYAVYAQTADPLLAAYVGEGWPEKYDREFRG